MAEFWKRMVARLMNRVRVNTVREVSSTDSTRIVKQRRIGASVVIGLGNQFLRYAKSYARLIADIDEWIAWELHCSQLLYPDRFVDGCSRGIVCEKVPGASIRQWIAKHELNAFVVIAVAREIRRVHQQVCSVFQAAWSHGDLHLDNILFDRTSGRAVLIDFDTRHILTTPAIVRQADDLKIVLLELLARIGVGWQSIAVAFLLEYGQRDVLIELKRQLVIPTGLAKVLWHTQTATAPYQRTQQRVVEFAQELQRITEGV